MTDITFSFVPLLLSFSSLSLTLAFNSFIVISMGQKHDGWWNESILDEVEV
jgi:hypothetical protein